MPSIARSPLALSALLIVAGCATQPPPHAPQTHASAPTDPVDDYIHAVMEKNHVPGVALAIVRDGKIEKMAAYGVADLESGAKVRQDTTFQIASATKIFTGTLVMLLVQEGKISLADPISKYLPGAPEIWKPITIRHLVAHASGLKDNPDDPNTPAASLADRYEVAMREPLSYTPGERSEYALTDFVVLTHVLERATGEHFEDLLERRIFKPLAFTCTRYEHATQKGPLRVADVVPHRASTYHLTDGAQQRAWFLYPMHTYAAGGAFSCVEDLARWAIAMDQGTLLTPQMQQIGATAFQLNDGRPGGFGVAFAVGKLRGMPIFGHSGGGALADVLRVPDKKLTVIVLTNEQGLLPALAPNITSLHLPPLPGLDEPGIADTDPALTRVLRGVVEGVFNGALDAAAFAPRAKEELVPVLRSFGTPESALYPPLQRMTLLEERKEGETWERVYRAVYGKDISLKWTFSLDAAGKILELEYDLE